MVIRPLGTEKPPAPCPAPQPAPLTCKDPSGEVQLDDTPAEGCGHHAQGRQQTAHQHDRPAAKAIHTHAAERAWGGQRLSGRSHLTQRPSAADQPGAPAAQSTITATHLRGGSGLLAGVCRRENRLPAKKGPACCSGPHSQAGTAVGMGPRWGWPASGPLRWPLPVPYSMASRMDEIQAVSL